MGILSLHGEPLWQLVGEKLKIEIPFVSVLALVTWWNFPLGGLYAGIAAVFIGFFLILSHLLSLIVVNNISTINEKIKAKKPYQKLMFINVCIKIILVGTVSFFISQSYNSYTNLGMTRTSLEAWKKLPDFTVLNFSADSTLLAPDTNTEKESAESVSVARSVVTDILQIGEQSGAVFVSNEEVLNDEIGSLSYMVVNPQFLATVPILDSRGEVIKLDNLEQFYLIVPENRREEVAAIEKSMRETIAFYKDIRSEKAYDGKLDILFSKADQDVLNLNTTDFTSMTNKNPILLVGSLNLYGNQSDNLVAELSQGKYLFTDTKRVLQYIKNKKLTEEFAGFTSVRETGLNNLRRLQLEFSQELMGMVLGFIVCSVINFLLICTYIQSQQKKLLVWYLFGKSFLERHLEFLSIMFGMTITTSLVVLMMGVTTIWGALSVMAIDIMVCLALLMNFEKREHIETLKKGE